MLILFTIYGLFRLEQGDWGKGVYTVYSYSFIKDHYMSLLPIYSFYYFTRRKNVTPLILLVVLILFGIISIIFFIRTYTEASKLTGQSAITNNSAYMFVSLVALLPLLKTKLAYKYLFLSILGVFVLMSAKRGAILAYILCVLEFVWFSIQHMPRRVRIKTMIGSSLLLIIGCYFAIYYIDSNEYLSLRLVETEHGSSSGRNLIFLSLIRHIRSDLSDIHLFFGNGADSTYHIAGNFAHNDWLEVMTNMGIVGIIIYLYYWLCVYMTYRQLSSYPSLSYAFLIIMTLCFMRTLYSMSISDMFVVTTMVIGYCIGEKDNNDRKKLWPKYIQQ